MASSFSLRGPQQPAVCLNNENTNSRRQHPPEHDKQLRLNSAIGFVTSKDRWESRHLEIFAARDQKLAAAPEKRKMKG